MFYVGSRVSLLPCCDTVTVSASPALLNTTEHCCSCWGPLACPDAFSTPQLPLYTTAWHLKLCSQAEVACITSNRRKQQVGMRQVQAFTHAFVHCPVLYFYL